MPSYADIFFPGSLLAYHSGSLLIKISYVNTDIHVCVSEYLYWPKDASHQPFKKLHCAEQAPGLERLTRGRANCYDSSVTNKT